MLHVVYEKYQKLTQLGDTLTSWVANRKVSLVSHQLLILRYKKPIKS